VKTVIDKKLRLLNSSS